MTSARGWLLVELVLIVCERFVMDMFWLRQFMYAYIWSELIVSLTHPLVYLLITPITCWIAGIYEIKLTRYSTVNCMLSILTLTLALPFISAIQFNQIILFTIATARRLVTMPTIWDFHPCSLFSVIAVISILVYFLVDVHHIVNGTSLSAIMLIYILAFTFSLKPTNLNEDNTVLVTLRRLGRITELIVIWASINTSLYFMFGSRISLLLMNFTK